MAMSRRLCLAALASYAASPLSRGSAWAKTAIDIAWADLIPAGAQIPSMSGIIEHGAASSGYSREQGEALNTALDGQTVRIPGFILPTEFEGSAVTGFLLVPYVGACIHVPPPPPNQMVYVTYEPGLEGTGLFAAINVTGQINAGIASTLVAPVGYTMAAERIEPYDA